MPQSKNVAYDPTATPSGKCPHAKAAREAAALAQKEAEKAAIAESASVSSAPAAKDGAFEYGKFYETELEKKHKDRCVSLKAVRTMAHGRSYRYFNNINRLAAKFPVAHTANTKDEVDVWCSNDYLGMSKNPVVLGTMK